MIWRTYLNFKIRNIREIRKCTSIFRERSSRRRLYRKAAMRKLTRQLSKHYWISMVEATVITYSRQFDGIFDKGCHQAEFGRSSIWITWSSPRLRLNWNARLSIEIVYTSNFNREAFSERRKKRDDIELRNHRNFSREFQTKRNSYIAPFWTKIYY